MNTTARTDIHRPSAPDFDPEGYDFSGAVFDLKHDEDSIEMNRESFRIRRELIAQGYKFSGVYGSGACDHCGARLRYAALLVHVPTHSLLYVGETCLDNRFSGQTKAEFALLQGEAAKARKAAKLREAFEEACERFPTLAYATYAHNISAGAEADTFWWKHINTLGDIAMRCRQYGDPSVKQVALMDSIFTKLEESEAKAKTWAAERAAEQAGRVDAHIGFEGQKKVEFTGILRNAVYLPDNGYGSSYMLIIDTPEGTVKWTSSSDKAFELADKGSGTEVSFTATIKKHGEYQGEKQTIVLRPKFA